MPRNTQVAPNFVRKLIHTILLMCWYYHLIWNEVFFQKVNFFVHVNVTGNIKYWILIKTSLPLTHSQSNYETIQYSCEAEKGGKWKQEKGDNLKTGLSKKKKIDCQSGSSIAAGWRCECTLFNLASILIYAGTTMRCRLWGAACWRTRPPLLCCASDALCRCSCEQRGEGGCEPGLISHSAPALQLLGFGDRHIHVCSPIVSASPIRMTARPWVRITFLFRSVTHQERAAAAAAAAAASVALLLRFSRCLHLVTRRDLTVNPIISHWPYFNGALNPH